MKILLTSVAFIATCASAFGWGGKLDTPLFAHPLATSGEQKKNAETALKFMHEELKFLDGEFINQFVHNRFAGTAQKTSRFIELLHGAACFDVRVRFRDFGEQESAFALDVVMGSEEVVVTVNSGRTDFGLKDFQAYLPKEPVPTKQPAKK